VSAVKWAGISKPLVFRVKIRFVLKSFYDSDTLVLLGIDCRDI